MAMRWRRRRCRRYCELWVGHEGLCGRSRSRDRDELCALKVEVGLQHFPNGEYEAAVEDMLQKGAAAAENMDELAASTPALGEPSNCDPPLKPQPARSLTSFQPRKSACREISASSA